MKRLLVSILFFFSFLFLLPPISLTNAITVRSGENVLVSSASPVNETFIGTGQSVRVDGDVRGDIFCAGQNLRITGNVEGDVICAGQILRIEGNVAGDVRFAGQTLVIKGTVGRNVTHFGQEIVVEEEGRVNGEIAGAGQSVEVFGVVAKDISGAMQMLTLAGSVNGNVDVEAQVVTLSDNATVQGDLLYRAPTEATIADSATVSGVVTYQKIDPREQSQGAKEFMAFISFVWLIGKVASLISLTLLALLVTYLLPRFMGDLVRSIQQDKLSLLGWGLVVLFLAPLLVFFLVMTIFGIPLALVLGLIWILVVILSKMIAGVYVGYKILSYNKKKNQKVSLPLAALIGVPALSVVTWIPIVGWVISFIALLLGIGSVFVYIRRYIRR